MSPDDFARSVERFRSSTEEKVKPIRRHNTLKINLLLVGAAILVVCLVWLLFSYSFLEESPSFSLAVATQEEMEKQIQKLEKNINLKLHKRQRSYQQQQKIYWQICLKNLRQMLKNTTSHWQYFRLRAQWENFLIISPSEIPPSLVTQATELQAMLHAKVTKMEHGCFQQLQKEKQWQIITEFDWLDKQLQEKALQLRDFQSILENWHHLDSLFQFAHGEQQLSWQLSSQGEKLAPLLLESSPLKQILLVPSTSNPKIDFSQHLRPLFVAKDKGKNGYQAKENSEQTLLALAAIYLQTKKATSAPLAKRDLFLRKLMQMVWQDLPTEERSGYFAYFFNSFSSTKNK